MVDRRDPLSVCAIPLAQVHALVRHAENGIQPRAMDLAADLVHTTTDMLELTADARGRGSTALLAFSFNEPPEAKRIDLLYRQANRPNLPDLNARECFNEVRKLLTSAGYTARKLKESTREPEVRSMSDIEEKDVHFLWRPYIAVGKVTMLEGDPGDGKSHLLCSLAAAVSSGGTMPHADGESWAPIDEGNVLLWSPEDDAGDTLKPRLRKAGACMERIDIFEGIRNGDEAAPVTIRDGIDVIAAALEAKPYGLFVIDTLTTCMGSQVDINKPNEGGEVMRKLKVLAERLNVAIVVTRHLKKSKSGGAIYDGLGSVAIAGTVRSILRVAVDTSDRRVRALFHVKSNCSEEGPPLGYEVDAHSLVWTGRASFDLSQARAEFKPKNTGPTKREQAAEWLRAELKAGSKKSADLYRRGDRAGFSKATLNRAKSDISAAATQHEKAWWWFLADRGFDDVEVS